MQLIEVATQMYRKARVIKHAGQGMSGSEQSEGLHVINALIDGLKIERLMFYQMIRTLFDAVAGQADYAVGALGDGANWEIERPEKIYGAGYIVPGSVTQTEIPMRVLQSFTEYQAIVNKQTRSTLSWVMYYRATLPTGTATLWPVPSADFQTTLYTPGTVSEFSDLMQDVLFPDGYREFLEYAGAMAVHDLYPENAISPRIERMAIEYKARIKVNQFTPTYMRADAAAMARPDRQGSWWGAREYTDGR